MAKKFTSLAFSSCLSPPSGLVYWLTVRQTCCANPIRGDGGCNGPCTSLLVFATNRKRGCG